MDDYTPTILNLALADELIVINSIYGDGTAVATYSDEDHTTVEVQLPEDDHTYHVRFPSTYPSQCPTITGIDPLYLNTSSKIASEICYFRACFVSNHIAGEVSFYETITSFDDIRHECRELGPTLVETLCQRDDPKVEALQERLSILAETVHTALADKEQTILDTALRISECSVCLEPVFSHLAAILPHCSHAFCSACLQAGVNNFLETRSILKCCGHVVPAKVVERFGNLDRASMIRYSTWIDEKCGANPIFCHERTCSAYIATYQVSELGALCSACGRLTCPSCRKAVHQGLCSRDMKMLNNLAKRQNWKFCPGCKQLVERSMGCKSMNCTCGTIFCYHCGTAAPPGVYHMGNCCLNGQLFDTMRRR